MAGFAHVWEVKRMSSIWERLQKMSSSESKWQWALLDHQMQKDSWKIYVMNVFKDWLDKNSKYWNVRLQSELRTEEALLY